jgi:hypothetical protein
MEIFMKRITILVFLFLGIMYVCGCGQKLPDGIPKLYPVTITIVQENTRLEGAIVQLIPEDPSLSNWGPMGITNASGVTELQTNGKYKGSPLGQFKVLVTKKEIEPHPHLEWGNLPDGDPKFIQYRNEAMKLKVLDYVEPQFGLINATPLSVNITSSGPNNFQLDVGKKITIESKRIL